MFNLKDPDVISHLYEGIYGLEKESLRVEHSGRMSHAPHYKENEHITRDFCENQTEINTAPYPTLEEAFAELHKSNSVLQNEAFLRNEMLWPFSNPGYIRDEEDIPVAQFEENPESTRYREYLKHRYGAYKMTFSGIHYNFSFPEKLLRAQYELEKDKYSSFREFTDHFYLDLAKKVTKYGWLVTVLTAASPILDSSFWNEGLGSISLFSGYASPRNSEIGYWNTFVPILNYDSISAYTDSIESYVDQGLLKAFRELYYPVRLKPKGKYSPENLRNGVDHIELRMIDLNPMEMDSLSMKDAQFIHYFLLWLAAMDELQLDDLMQIEAVQNFKRAAAFDLDLNFIFQSLEEKLTVREASLQLLEQMMQFYHALPDSRERSEALRTINWERKKLLDSRNYRYANIISDLFQDDYLIKGTQLARFNQSQFLQEKRDNFGK